VVLANQRAGGGTGVELRLDRKDGGALQQVAKKAVGRFEAAKPQKRQKHPL